MSADVPARQSGSSRRWSIAGLLWMGLNGVLVAAIWYWPLDSGMVRDQSPWVPDGYEPRVWPERSDQAGRVRQLRYRLLIPPDVADALPLLLFLHGSGQRGTDNEGQLKGLPTQLVGPEWRRRCPAIILAPQCPADTSWESEIPALVSLVESWREDPRVDRRRIYVTGLSMGGFGTWKLLAARPELFAAAVPICGGGDPASAAVLSGVPVWAVHGDDDVVVPVEQSRRMIAAIREAGGQPRYTELAGAGHDCWTAAYGDPQGVLAWMFRQRNTRAD